VGGNTVVRAPVQGCRANSLKKPGTFTVGFRGREESTRLLAGRDRDRTKLPGGEGGSQDSMPRKTRGGGRKKRRREVG